MRTILFLGHSGRAQSAVAIATAYRAAQLGKRTLLASSGPLHRIGTLLGQKLTAKATEIEPNLYATETAALTELDQQWNDLIGDVRGVLANRLRDIRGDELPLLSGIDELAGVIGVERLRKAGKFDLVVLDGPPPTQLMRTLALPDAFRWGVRQFLGLDRGPGRSRASQEAALLPIGLVPSTISTPVQNLRVFIEEVRGLFEASNGTIVRLVLPPEDLELPAIYQSIGALGLYSLEVDAVVATGAEAGEIAALRTRYTPRTVLSWERSAAGWAEQGAALYGELTPDEILSGTPTALEQESGELTVHIPFIDPANLQIADTGDEAIIQLGPYRRHLLLPPALRNRPLRARVDGELLRLWVEEKE